MIELGIYENIKSLIRRFKQRDTTQTDELFAAGITGAIVAFVTTPLDLIKTKMTMQVST